ncbi:SAYSvFN domain-containing protein 1 [Trichosurus vulpecula]|uniref:SAYSvFN domain-containing protein 1 n=1 Tax=Trichosurus vulpecula TaxID=9337 RepID=UPI00186B10EC|nr:SAYSvFN domain-containing protein 1 [Trichosurus vulpecula]
MEQRLAAFRATRKRAELEGGPSTSGRCGKAPGEDVAAPPTPSQAQEAPGGRAKEPFQTQGSPLQNPAATSPSRWDQSFLTNVTFLKVALWLVLLGLFVELEFGLVYFVLSLFYWMYVGTRGPGEKKKGEKSAYSVFNPGCKPIQGTLTAEQFERELQFHPLAGR